MYPVRKKIVIIIGIILLVGTMGLLIFLSLRHRGEVAITIEASPTDSTITIDGQPAKAGKLYVKKGTHSIKGSRQFFTDATEKIDAQKQESIQAVYLLLGADSPEAIAYLQSHPDEQQERERLGAARAAARSQAFVAKNPIINELPYRTLDYKIDYVQEPDYGVSFVVTVYPVATTPGTDLYNKQVEEMKAAALDYLKNQGLDTKKAKISFEVSQEHQ